MSAPEPDERNGEADLDVDDAFRAILEGLRTTIPGVQVLFAFLLTVPLQSSFEDVSTHNRVVFYTAFACSALASVLLIAPSVHQRVRAPMTGLRRRTKSHVLTAVRLAIAGTVFAGLAIIAVTYLVSSLVFARSAAAAAAGVIGGSIAWSWFYLPVIRFARDGRGHRR